ncbi:MAG: hypothetical protein AB3N21_14155 [Ruegeria sp.]|uniref:hypothetical protein n=1 Tax=Ruegeria sp. TaxID=1879320 RepID=UPI00349EB9A7
MPDHLHKLVNQHLRDRQIEALELASSWSAQSKYQSEVAGVSIPNEVINQWDDVFHSDNDRFLSEPLYSKSEIIALRKYARVLNDVCKKTPNLLPEVPEIFELSAWKVLRSAAQEALDVMMIRGPFTDGAQIEDDH